MDTEEDSFPLATVLFDCQLTRQYSKPLQHAPEACRAAFAAQAGAKVLLNLFRVSRGARDVVLQSAPRLTLRLDVTSRRAMDLWARQLEGVVQRLGTRGDLPVALRVKWDDSPVASALLTLIPPALQGVSAGVTELTVEYTDGPLDGALDGAAVDQRVAEFFLQRAAAVLPNLRSLKLKHWLCTIPPPHSLPQLTQLSIPGEHSLQGELASAAHSSVARLLPQLGSFTVHTHYLGEGKSRLQPTSMQAIFTPIYPTHTLTRFETKGSLTDELLSALQHAPALRELRVRSIALRKDHRASTWGVRRLALERTLGVPLTSITRLPTNPDHIVEILTPESISACGFNSFTSVTEPMLVVAQRATEWLFPCLECIYAENLNDPFTADNFIHFPAVVRSLAGLQAPRLAELRLAGRGCAGTSLHGIAAALQGLPHVRVTLVFGDVLTDGLLCAVLHMGPKVKALEIRRMALQSDQHANAPWPWDEVLFYSDIDVTLLAQLPDPAACSTAPVLRCDNIAIGSVTEAMAERLAARLSHVFIAPDSRHFQRRVHQPKVTFTVTCTNGTSAGALQAQLSMLRAVRLQPTDSDTGVLVKLQGCPMTTETIAVLSGLPAWRGRFEFSECQWPASEQGAALCAQLAQHVPVSYTRWVVPYVYSEGLKHVCAGVNQRREGLGMAPLTVCAHLPTEPDVRAALAGKHVELESLRTLAA